MSIDNEVLAQINKQTSVVLTREDAEIVAREAARYNGWANRETWAAALNLDNDEDLYVLAHTAAKQDEWGNALKDLAEVLEDQAFERSVGPIARSLAVGFIKDVGSLWRVDWKEVRDGLTEGMEEVTNG